jgi:microcystin-dependent protein
MSEPFLAEVRIVGFNFPPRGWATCDGQILPIDQNQSLYSLLGTTYGGDGRTTFALPDLRGRTPIHDSSSYTLGQRAGTESHPLSTAEMPAHTHTLQGSSNDATEFRAPGNVFARATQTVYGPPGASTPLSPQAVADAGSGTPHPNMQPYLVLNFVIALQGLFPPRN